MGFRCASGHAPMWFHGGSDVVVPWSDVVVPWWFHGPMWFHGGSVWAGGLMRRCGSASGVCTHRHTAAGGPVTRANGLCSSRAACGLSTGCQQPALALRTFACHGDRPSTSCDTRTSASRYPLASGRLAGGGAAFAAMSCTEVAAMSCTEVAVVGAIFIKHAKTGWHPPSSRRQRGVCRHAGVGPGIAGGQGRVMGRGRGERWAGGRRGVGWGGEGPGTRGRPGRPAGRAAAEAYARVWGPGERRERQGAGPAFPFELLCERDKQPGRCPSPHR